MGPVNRDLVVANHRANVHAQELVELLRPPRARRARDRLPHEEMARLVRLEWRARVDAQALRRELSRRDEQLELSKRETADAGRAHGADPPQLRVDAELAGDRAPCARRATWSAARWRGPPVRAVSRAELGGIDLAESVAVAAATRRETGRHGLEAHAQVPAELAAAPAS